MLADNYPMLADKLLLEEGRGPISCLKRPRNGRFVRIEQDLTGNLALPGLRAQLIGCHRGGGSHPAGVCCGPTAIGSVSVAPFRVLALDV